MKCNDCGNTTKFYEINTTVDVIEVRPTGDVDYTESLGSNYDHLECYECKSDNVEEGN